MLGHYHKRVLLHKFTEKILWTNHARDKMRHYRLTESRIKRIIRHPTRVEEGILEGAVAAMQPASASATAGRPAKRYAEIWVMYIPTKFKVKSLKLKVITAWRYPGRAPERDPVPLNILQEIRKIL